MSRPALASLILGAVTAAAFVAGPADGARTSRGSTPAVPAIQARRIAAQCSGRLSYAPSWLPQGFRFAGWSAGAYLVACDEGPTLRYRRGAARLTWEATGVKKRALRCDGRTSVAAHLAGRTIYRRVHNAVEEVWTCINVGFPLTVRASQRVGAPGASSAELERMVASARPLPPGRAAGQQYELVPGDAVRAIVHAFGKPLFLPSSLPAGFIFSTWSLKRHDVDTGGRSSLFVTFGRDGPTLDWGVYAGKDTLGLDCPVKKSKFVPPKLFAAIHGVRVFLDVGIHGGSAWRCIPAGAVGNAQPLEVELWYDIRLDSPSMRRQVASIVANARLLKNR